MSKTLTTPQTQNKINTSQEVLVEVNGLSKKFCKDLKTSLWYGVKDLISGYSGNKKKRELRPKEFWAVKDISFTLKRGECLGLIGHNGAGKSTLLKILNGLINPDEGQVKMRGRVGALIELGAGFNPVLTGRENIYNNGAILGFTRKEIDQKLQTIIGFAELEEFIDMPVRNYSSGMKVRLGFAVATQMEPDILIIDEVLAVGDMGFVLKCFKTIDTILPHTAIIFVSHSMPMVSRICNQIILMDKGQAKFQGDDVSKAIDLYYTRFTTNNSNVVFTDKSLKILKAKVLSKYSERKVPILKWGDDLELELEIEILDDIDNTFQIDVIFYDKEQRPIASLKRDTSFNYKSLIKSSKLKILLKHHKLQFSQGIYSINISIVDQFGPKYRVNSICEFQITNNQHVWRPFMLNSKVINLN
ncbi:ABC transporter ATP-binding protein [Flavobacterium sp. CS20]|uniref:ABC transporter ATP-binding protein n=1 Tax=Flavobacterium sp. CS20 TaxID=2775246 RepID=UPI001B3A4309|nr:ABC transporter ATP-binding protein [Flavobacterium sp. CS20]QTY27699.1 ABC transporter ATP-binding protein [Flavobacterium sp. CS20]